MRPETSPPRPAPTQNSSFLLLLLLHRTSPRLVSPSRHVRLPCLGAVSCSSSLILSLLSCNCSVSNCQHGGRRPRFPRLMTISVNNPGKVGLRSLDPTQLASHSLRIARFPTQKHTNHLQMSFTINETLVAHDGFSRKLATMMRTLV
jgi:hypothetical protein